MSDVYSLIHSSSLFLSSASPLAFDLSGGKECLCNFLCRLIRSGGEDFIFSFILFCILLLGDFVLVAKTALFFFPFLNCDYVGFWLFFCM